MMPGAIVQQQVCTCNAGAINRPAPSARGRTHTSFVDGVGPVGRSEGEALTTRRRGGVAEEGQVTPKIIDGHSDPIRYREVDVGAELQIGPDAQGDVPI